MAGRDGTSLATGTAAGLDVLARNTMSRHSVTQDSSTVAGSIGATAQLLRIVQVARILALTPPGAV